MTILNQQRRQLQLAAGAVLSGRLDASRLVTVRSGLVWITQAGRGEDFWLGAGEGIILQPRQLLVIEAAMASELELEYNPESGLAAWCRARVRSCLAGTLVRSGQGGD
jgi:hypothetical protein